MIIERNDFGEYSVRYDQAETPLCKFRTLGLAALFVRYLNGNEISGHDEYMIKEAIRKYEKGLK